MNIEKITKQSKKDAGSIGVETTVRRTELNNTRMVNGNEDKYSKVIIDGKVNEWVAIGWIELDEYPDKSKYPVVID